MALRSVALCDGKFVGIETIYTVIDGQQINIPEKLKELREKSRRNELFCPCGCGTNLILVAGDNNLREQHFRIKQDAEGKECKAAEEGAVSVWSRIVLHCWLADKLEISGVESRVPIGTVEGTGRKPEFSFLSRERKFAVRYWMTRANIMEDRLDALEGNTSGIRVAYVVDSSNRGGGGQYPEALMKLQERQGYCLLLSVGGAEYGRAELMALFYAKDLDGFWREVVFSDAPLRSYGISEGNEIMRSGKTLEQLCSEARARFDGEMERERRKREAVRKRNEERMRREQEEKERKEEEERKRHEEEERLREQRERERKRKEQEALEEKARREEEFRRVLESDFSRLEEPVVDADGVRWFMCEFCGKKARVEEFVSYGGQGNIGKCNECKNKKREGFPRASDPRLREKGNNANKCPFCKGLVVERMGKFGPYKKCSTPGCGFSESIRKC